MFSRSRPRPVRRHDRSDRQLALERLEDRLVPVNPPLLLDAGFEQVSVGSGPAAFVYNPSSDYFLGAGISGNGSAFT